SRVLAIDDDEIEPEIGNEAGKLFPNCRAAGLADHVAEKKKSHGRLLEHFSAKWNPVAHIETVKIVRLAEAAQTALREDFIQHHVMCLVRDALHLLAAERR